MQLMGVIKTVKKIEEAMETAANKNIGTVEMQRRLDVIRNTPYDR